MLTRTLTTAAQQATRRSGVQKAVPVPAASQRAVPRLNAADQAVFQAVGKSSKFTLDGLKKLAAR